MSKTKSETIEVLSQIPTLIEIAYHRPRIIPSTNNSCNRIERNVLQTRHIRKSTDAKSIQIPVLFCLVGDKLGLLATRCEQLVQKVRFSKATDSRFRSR